MKNLKLFILALAIGTTSLFASNMNQNETEKKEIKNNIVKLESYSNYTNDTEKKVTLKFSINSNAEIVVLSLDSKNATILNYVRQNLNGKKITESTITFKAQKTIELKFSINSNSEIVVLSINTKNRDILNYVRENLNGKKI